MIGERLTASRPSRFALVQLVSGEVQAPDVVDEEDPNQPRKGWQHEHDDTTEIRGWKLFFLLPRILLHRPPRGGLVPKAQLQERVDKSLQGQWVALLETSLELSIQGAAASCRRRRGQKDTIERRAARAFELCQLGKLSSARQALEGAAIAPGDSKTEKLKDETRRPRVARIPIDRSILEVLLQNLHTARRGAAAGPSGMTAEHLKPLLADTVCTRLFGEVTGQFAGGLMPEEVLQAVKLGRMTALAKPDGGVRGIVAGDVFRRVVARTMAQQFTPLAEAATHPFQYALSTRAGTECVAHIVQSLSELDPRSTILSIDGVGAFDNISWATNFRGVADMPTETS